MLWLARQTIRAHRTGFVAAFVAVLCGSALIMACGVLVESGVRGGMEPDRYAAAPIVVTAPQSAPVVEDVDLPFAERAPLPESALDELAQLDGVETVIGDVTVRADLRTPHGKAATDLHGWSSAQLDSVELADGRRPNSDHEIVVPDDLDAQVGDTVDIARGGVVSEYRVTGLVGSGNGAFLSDGAVRTLSGDPDTVDAAAVLPESGTDPDELAERVERSIAKVEVSTGNDRADAEFFDLNGARSYLIQIGAAFGGTLLMIVLIVVASTLGLSVQQRRREFALLRAVAATPRQVYRMLGSEAALVAAVAALVGLVPGVMLSLWLRSMLVDLDLAPDGFTFTFSPLPAVIAVFCCVGAAWLGGIIAARRANRISPVEAIRTAAADPSPIGRIRRLMGWLTILFGAGLGVAVPLLIGGPTALGGAAGSVLLLVVGVALLGPSLLSATARVLAGLGFARTTAGWLADANARANARRLGTATTPLIMGVALAAVQIFGMTTTADGADRQLDDGLIATDVLVAPDGIAPEVVDAVREVPGASVTPVAQSQVLVTYDELGDPVTEPFPAQGIAPDGIEENQDLEVRSGELSRLADGTVAVSRFAADAFGASIGSSLDLQLGDGTPYEARVVAIYDRGLGFGDVTLPDDVVRASTTSGMNDYVLVSGADHDALTTALEPYEGVSITDRDEFASAQVDGQSGDETLGLMLNLALLAFIGIAVVNLLVLATAARVREFALLRLVGAGPRHVRAMMRRETVIVIAAAVIIGTLIAVPPLVGFSFAVVGSAMPSIPPAIYLAIVAVAVVLGWCSIGLPTRIALRDDPKDALGVGE